MTRNEEVESWYKAKSKHIRKWASKYKKEDGEDILQEIAVNLLTNPAKWEAITRSKVQRWVMYEYYNPRGQKYQSGVVLPLESALTVASPVDLTEELFQRRSVELVTELMNELSGASRQIFEMRFFHEMGYDKIAEKLDMSHGSVKQLGSRAAKIVTEKFKGIVG